ncbi:spore cortex biosynthesis protein YabQ [Alicyclobacillus hesperidum]|uniref:Spore cortex biosynthesis protein YabQ n=1 Tax=Alicyclobacillus hesperidum TaxID=89784 RepID=A0A1H2TNP4_9BACL|nr:spore cortex biosynthesis protein YabQ [Alicyclobacillus hesperidum]SDW44879.1 spore cortex biosynthesis protein YabQ [Alicyclobacillus hesperidum]
MNTAQNAAYVAWMVLCGMAMGATFDFYNTITGASRWLRRLRPLFDLAFWLVAAVVAYVCTYRTISGAFRIWTFLLLTAGYALYRLLLRRWVVGSAFAILHVMRVVVLICGRMLYMLFGVPARLIWRLVSGLATLLYRLGCRFEDVMARLLSIVFLILTFPIRRYVAVDAAWRKKLSQWQEEFWQLTAKWLRRTRKPVQ